MTNIEINRRKLFLGINVILLAFIATIFFSKFIYIHILRVILTIFLLFVVGILLLRILSLDVYTESITEIIILSVGLSIATLILYGLFINFFYPVIGIYKPFSGGALIVSIIIFIAILNIICYFRGSNAVYNINITITPTTLFALSLPFISVLGVYLLNFYNNNKLLLILFTIIASIPILTTFNKIDRSEYPLVLWAISISLLLYGFLTRAILRETYMPGVIVLTGRWNPALYARHNTLLPNVILHPIFIIMGRINFLTEPKIIQPIISSTSPILLYIIFKNQISEKLSFLSVYLFISCFQFYNVNTYTVRVPMSFFFLVYLEYFIVDKKLPAIYKDSLVVLFTFLLITSHYGTSYIFMFASIGVSILILFLKRCKIWSKTKTLCNHTYILFYSTLALGWYIFSSGSIMFRDIVKFFSHILKVMHKEFTSPKQSLTFYALTAQYPLSLKILRELYLVVMLFMVIGLIFEVYKSFVKFIKKFDDEYILFSLIFLIAVLSTYLPTKWYNPTRVSLVSYAFLSPFFVFGVKRFIDIFNKYTKYYIDNLHSIVAIFLVVFFLFNSGVISVVVTKDRPPGAILAKEEIIKNKNIYDIISLFMRYNTIYDIKSSIWITKFGDPIERVYCDFLIREKDLRYRNNYIPEYGLLPNKNNRPRECIISSKDIKKIRSGNYIFLGYHNLKYKIIVSQYAPLKFFSISKLLSLLHKCKKIYTNGNSTILCR